MLTPLQCGVRPDGGKPSATRGHSLHSLLLLPQVEECGCPSQSCAHSSANNDLPAMDSGSGGPAATCSSDGRGWWPNQQQCALPNSFIQVEEPYLTAILALKAQREQRKSGKRRRKTLGPHRSPTKQIAVLRYCEILNRLANSTSSPALRDRAALSCRDGQADKDRRNQASSAIHHAVYRFSVQQRRAAAARAPCSGNQPCPAACAGLSAAARAQCRASGSLDGGDRPWAGAGP